MNKNLVAIFAFFLSLWRVASIHAGAFYQTSTEAGKLYWKEGKPQPTLIGLMQKDEAGQPRIYQHYEYDDQKRIAKETLYGNLSGRCSSPLLIEEDGIPQSNGIESYSTIYTYSKEFSDLLAGYREDNGMEMVYRYDPKTKQCTAKLLGNGDSCLSRCFYAYDAYGFLSAIILDDGTTDQIESLEGVTHRTLMRISSCPEGKAAGQPLEIQTYYLDLLSRQEVLLESKKNFFSANGRLIQEDFLEADGSLRYCLYHDYDSEGSLIATTDSRGMIELPGEAEDKKRLDASGKTIATIDSYGNETEYFYDAQGRIALTVYPEVLSVDGYAYRPESRQSYTLGGQSASVQNRNGGITHTEYNARGQPIRITHPDLSSEALFYDLDGQLCEQIQANGFCTKIERDSFRRVHHENTFALSGSLIKTLVTDYRGNLVSSVTDEQGLSLLFEYDGAGRQKEVFRQFNGEIRTAPPAEPTKEASSTSPHFYTQTHTIKNSRDQYVKMEEKVDIRGMKQVAVFDALQRLATLTTYNGMGIKIKECEYRYDGNGQKLSEKHAVLANGKPIREYEIRWSYDLSNRLICFQERPNNGQVKSTFFQYDPYGKLQSVTKPDGTTISYTYNDKGDIASFMASDGSFHYEYEYDPEFLTIRDLLHNITQHRHFNGFQEIITDDLGFEGGILTRFYDECGRPDTLRFADGSAVRYGYAEAYLRSVQRINPEGELVYQHLFTHDPQTGRLKNSDMAGGLGEIDYWHDGRGRLSTIDSRYWSETVTEEGFSHSGQLLATTVSDPLGAYSCTFDYDYNGQLTYAQDHLQNFYQYDSLYNRTEENETSCECNEWNQLISTSKARYEYDVNGNLISKETNDKRFDYEYDALNRLTKVIVNQNQAYAYVYDALHRRIQRSVLKRETPLHNWEQLEQNHFLYDDLNEIGSVVDGTITKLRLLAPGTGSEAGSAVALELQGEIYAPIHDRHGSIRCIVSLNDRSVKEFYRTSAFGAEALFSSEGGSLDPDQAINPWRYCGKRYDNESGLIFFGRRFYDPESGRWISPDPLFSFDTANLYAFVQNDPVNRSDRYGLFSIVDSWNDFKNFAWEYLQPWVPNYRKWIEPPSLALLLPDYMSEPFEKVGKAYFGYYFQLLLGFNPEEGSVGVRGKGEVSDKVRVTFINGILTTHEGMLYNMDLLSESHGGVNVHYVFHPTRGWTNDLIHGTLLRVAFRLGYQSDYSILLASHWRNLIQEMGGVDGGGMIIHYAHSLGGLETDRAGSLLTPEERQMIRIITFASVSLFCDEGYHSVEHHVSINDIVVYIGDPFKNLLFPLYQWDYVHYYGNLTGAIWDHVITSNAYFPVLQTMGKKFINEFIRR